MGLRCLMGHDFGEVLTDRDRRERGNEVVVTITEYRECDRCGQTRVVSENKEVRHAGPTGPDATDDDVTGGFEADDARSVSAGAADFGDDDISAEEDDGLILEDDPEPKERDPGAWPEVDAEAPADEEEEDAEPAPWPEVEGEDEGFSAEPGDGSGLEGVQFDSGLTPEASPGGTGGSTADGGGDVVESSGGSDTGGFHRSTSIPSSSGRQRSEEADTEFFCPECEHTTPTDGSSLRPGDICPDCRLGYLTERAR